MIEEYGKSKTDWFREFLEPPKGNPSHDTFSDVVNRFNPEQFYRAFSRWVSDLSSLKVDVVVVDGRVMCRTLGKANGNPLAHLVSAWSVQNNLCLGQVKVTDKSNDITAIPALLELLDIERATITTDAMGCQFDIGNKVIDAKASYVCEAFFPNYDN